VVIIVPIASTFSTAIKIEEFLSQKSKVKEHKILQPFINVLYISDKQEKALNSIEKSFGWKKKDIYKKSITVSAFYEHSENTTRNQRYFLTLPSEWQAVESCKLCFPKGNKENSDYLLQEKPLFFTDKTSVTPALIFDTPKPRRISVYAANNEWNLNFDTLLYGHIGRDDNHYHYYIKIEKFLADNIDSVKSWLWKIKEEEIFQFLFRESGHIVIIAIGHYSNTSFINLVNEILFSNAATIIHYDTSADHIQNFKMFYGREVEDYNTKVIFVDDTITTGATFRQTNYFLKHTRQDQKGFDACITLLDRSSYFGFENNLLKLSNKQYYLSFANLHLPSLKEVDGECPLCIERDRYSNLVENSFLDRMKVHFLDLEEKLRKKPINNINMGKRSNPEHSLNRYTSRIEAIHRIYEWCSENDFSEEIFEKWKNELLKKTKSPYSIQLLNPNTGENGFMSSETATFLKVLTQPPFIHYKSIRDNTFNWVLTLLHEQSSPTN
jgi:hypothetical protein